MSAWVRNDDREVFQRDGRITRTRPCLPKKQNHLGHDDAALRLEDLSELLIHGGERPAVSAPGGIELDEDVLGRVHGHRVEIVRFEV